MSATLNLPSLAVVQAQGRRVDDTTYELAQAIYRLRRARGMRQYELAATIGVSKTQMSLIEAGRRGYSLEQLVKMADALGFTLTITFGEKKNGEANSELGGVEA